MKRRLFEFEDLSWFPPVIRESMTDYLRYVLNSADLYKPITGILADSYKKSGATQILDLCSGSGGSVEQIQKNIRKDFHQNVHFVLSDKFPNIPAYKLIEEKTNDTISFVADQVDASMVPKNLKGFRTIFSGFHHFDKQTATAVLKNAVEAKEGIAIFDGGNKNILIILTILFGHPLVFFFFTPFFRPFRFSRIFFTYVVPLIPLCTIWDGIVSIIRLYTPAELLKIAKDAGPDYIWVSGKVKNRFGMSIAYLVGNSPAE